VKQYRKVSLDSLTEDPNNARVHDARNIDAIKASLTRFGQVEPLVVRKGTSTVVGGNGRIRAMRDLGWTEAEVREVELTDGEATALGIALNRTAELATWDEGILAASLASLENLDFDLSCFGFSQHDMIQVSAYERTAGLDLEAASNPIAEAKKSLAQRFLVPPFSVLDARQGYWRDRSAKWEGLGLNSRSGRSEGLISGSNGMTFRDPSFYAKKRETEATIGRELSTEEFKRDHYVVEDGGPNGTSVFDPVVAEIAYSWFCPKGGAILDPFAGGSTRGVVAGLLGRSYLGIDLRPEQVEANRTSATEIFAAAYAALLSPALAREAPQTPAANVEPDSPPWAKGFPLAMLEAIAAVFGAHDKGMIFGAFGKVKEAMVADWLESGKLSTITSSTGEIVGAVVLEEASKPAKLTDFTDATIGEVPKGAMRLRRLACPAEYGAALVDLIQEKRGARALVAEIWQEHPVDRAVVEALGLTWIGSKVRASSEIVGMWHSEQTAEVVPPREKLALVRLALNFDVDPLAKAIARLGPAWVDHYSSYNKHHSWKALALRGYGGRTDFIVKPSEMSKAWKIENAAALSLSITDTPLRALLPEVEPILALIPGRHHRVRLMRLAPDDGELSRHADITDPDSGIANGKLLRLHIPIETNPGVVFEQWLLDGNMVRGHMGRGETWSIDTRKPHRAFNRGPTERIHLVVDVESTAELRALLGENLPPVSVVEPAKLGAFRASETKGGAPTPVVGSSAKMPEWIVGDSRKVLDSLPSSFDFVFSCPPYADLERYSDDAEDLSTMEYPAFLDAYREIIAKSVALLRPDSFACFVVGEVRDTKSGIYRNFVSDTIRAFLDAGCSYYNEAILVTAAGSLPIRIARIFSAMKKLGKTHQNVLVFVKGDARTASDRVGAVDVADPAASFGEVVE